MTLEWNGHALWITALSFAGVAGLRLDAGPDGAVALWRALRAAGAELLVYPGLGVLSASFPASEADVFAGAAAIARAAGGEARLERALDRFV